MKRLILACLLAISSHGWAANLNPKCYELFEQFEQHVRDRVKAGGIANGMYYMKCWPALQNPGMDEHQALQPAISTCNDLVPHIVRLVDEQRDLKILKVYDANPMTYDTIDRAASGHGIFTILTDNKGRSARVRQRLYYDDKGYTIKKGYYDRKTKKYVRSSTVLVPNSEPFAASPLTGTTRVLDCSGEARYTDGTYLIQMYMDRDSDGQEFIGMAVLMELR